MQTRLVVSLLIAVTVVPACLRHKQAAVPLYPQPEQPRADNEVACLYGGIRQVDGQNVARLGQTFSLLPGCHIVVLADVGEMGTTSGYVANVGGATFALRMRAGHTYAVQIDTEVLTGTTGRVVIQTIERDASGTKVAHIAPATSGAEVAACQDWNPNGPRASGLGPQD